MTPQQQEQLIKELEKLREWSISNQKQSGSELNKSYYAGEALAYFNSIQLLKQTTVNRSSTEPKFIEG